MATWGGWSLTFPEWAVGRKHSPQTQSSLSKPAASGPEAPGREKTPVEQKTATALNIQPDQLLGRWVRNGSIQRDIVFLPEGKATLTVRLDYFSALLYGREMQMDLVWKLENGILTNTVIGGTPQANVARLIKDFGDTLSYRIVKVDQTELVLKDIGNADEGLTRWVAVK